MKPSRIGLLPAATKKQSHDFIGPIATHLEKKGCKIFLDDGAKGTFSYPTIQKDTPIDVFITLGGDGTLCYFKRKYRRFHHVPYTAVNLGGLGFMADLPISDLETYLDDLVEGNFTVEKRLMVETHHEGSSFVGINDIVIHRGEHRGMISLKVHINGSYFNTFVADGVIVATPTGSSAYSLASGGPLMYPSLHALVITPICAHTLTNRPFVIDGFSSIEIEYLSEYGPIFATIDGIETLPLKQKDQLIVKASEETFDLINYPDRQDYFSTLRSKLHWKGSA